MLWLTYEAREAPESSCEVVLQKDQWQALSATIHQTPTPPQQPPTLHEAVYWLASLAGHDRHLAALAFTATANHFWGMGSP